jgi:hypothetical protein
MHETKTIKERCRKDANCECEGDKLSWPTRNSLFSCFCFWPTTEQSRTSVRIHIQTSTKEQQTKQKTKKKIDVCVLTVSLELRVEVVHSPDLLLEPAMMTIEEKTLS